MKMGNRILLGMVKSSNFFSGFCLQNESHLFDSYLQKSAFSYAGFSFGAQKLVDFALVCEHRIDKIQLFSPAFFNDKDDKFKRMQLMFWSKNSQQYIANFLSNCIYPSHIDISEYLKNGTFEELRELLYYNWSEEKLLYLKSKNIHIEVFFGQEDRIINSQKGFEFFSKFSKPYFIKNVGHVLK